MGGIIDAIVKSGFKAKPVKPENLHITVAFLGDLVPAAVETIQQLVSDLAFTPTTLHLNRLGHWRKPRVVWIGCRKKPVELITQIELLQSQLKRVGFRLDDREFEPHATLFRKAPRKPRVDISPIEWSIPGLTVVHSTLTADGPHYEIISTSNNK